jgi:hypothetical protein
MSSFLEFLSAAADFALMLNLKAANCRRRLHRHADAHAPTRRQIAPRGKGAVAPLSGDRPQKKAPPKRGAFFGVTLVHAITRSRPVARAAGRDRDKPERDKTSGCDSFIDPSSAVGLIPDVTQPEFNKRLRRSFSSTKPTSRLGVLSVACR